MAHHNIGYAPCLEVREICYDGHHIADWRHTFSKVAEKQGFDSQQGQGPYVDSVTSTVKALKSSTVRACNMGQNVHALVGINPYPTNVENMVSS